MSLNDAEIEALNQLWPNGRIIDAMAKGFGAQGKVNESFQMAFLEIAKTIESIRLAMEALAQENSRLRKDLAGLRGEAN